MIEIHNVINNSSNKDNAIETYIRELGNKFKLLFIDEMHIFNIVDALIIKKIFFFLSKYKRKYEERSTTMSYLCKYKY